MKLKLSFMLTSGLVRARFQWNTALSGETHGGAGLVFSPYLEQHCIVVMASIPS